MSSSHGDGRFPDQMSAAGGTGHVSGKEGFDPKRKSSISILLWRNKIAAQHQEGPAISRFDRR